MTITDLLPRILAGTPPWVWAVLALLVFLGVRRLKPRRTHLLVAALAPTAFTIWSVSGVLAAAIQGSPGVTVVVWAAALAVGALTVFAHRGSRPTAQGGGMFLFAGASSL